MERLNESTPSGLTSNALHTWGMLFLVIGIAGRSIIQNRLLGIGTINGEQLLALMSASQANMILATAALLLQAAETCAVPIFAFLLVEGFLHTKDWKRYFLRVVGVALISELPYNLAIGGSFWFPDSRNPVFALAIGLVVLFFFRYYHAKSLQNTVIKLLVMVAALLWMLMLQVDNGVQLVILIAILWALRNKHQMRDLVGAVVSIAMSILSPFYMASPMAFLAIHMYNGEIRDKNRKVKYLSYPVVLLLIGLIAKYTL